MTAKSTTKSTTKSTGGAPPSPTQFLGALFPESAAWPGAALDGVNNAGQEYVKSVAEVNQEIANFVQNRLRHDIALGESLSRCRTLADATKAQGDWLKQATDDYAAETQKLFELGSRLMRGSWMPLQESGAKPGADVSEPSEP
jgi:hypothetical protein